MEENIVNLNEYIKEQFCLPQTDTSQYSPLTLAFIGDGIYDLVIRTVIVQYGNAPVNKLHRQVSNYVKAQAQMKVFHKIEPILTTEEKAVYKRGRNAKSFTTAKNASIAEYKVATGLEALMGYLYLSGKMERIIQLIKSGISEID